MINPENGQRLCFLKSQGEAIFNECLSYVVKDKRRKIRISADENERPVYKVTSHEKMLSFLAREIKGRDAMRIISPNIEVRKDIVNKLCNNCSNYRGARCEKTKLKSVTGIFKPQTEEERKAGIYEVNSILFARRLWLAGHLDANTFYWKKLHDLYMGEALKLSSADYEKLRLEVFLKARELANEGDTSLLEEYRKIGVKSLKKDFDRLETQENFITEKLEKTSWKKEHILLVSFVELEKRFVIREMVSKKANNKGYSNGSRLPSCDETTLPRVRFDSASVKTNRFAFKY